MQSLRAMAQRMPRASAAVAAHVPAATPAPASAAAALPALLHAPRRCLTSSSRPLLSSAASSDAAADVDASDAADAVPLDDNEAALYRQFEAEAAAKVRRPPPRTATMADAGPGRRGIPDPVYKHEELHGAAHRQRPVKQVIPVELSPEKQGTGASFIPTLLRPVEWIRPTQPQVPPPLPWHPGARRTGLLGTKLGMMQLWDHHGVRLPITVIKIDSQVIGVHNQLSPRGLLGLQVGTGKRKLKNTKKAFLVHCAKNGVWPPRRVVEFQCTPDAMLPPGYRFSVRHFVPGQFLDITGTSIGKGFQGGMKKWGFSGLMATHGVSVTHRSIGSTGGRQDPGRVFKGKKMPGRMGGKRVTKQNNKLFKIDCKRNLLFIVGAVPGNKGNYVIIRDAVKKPWNPETPPPFPTFLPKKGDEEVEEIVCAPAEADPFAFGVA